MSKAKKSGGQLHAVLALLMLITSTCLCFLPILFIGLLKLVPVQRWKLQCTRVIDGIVTLWIAANNTYIDKTQKVKWDITGLNNLSRKNWYLVVANHQSWLDIVILQRLFNRQIPVLKFFIKDQLKWVPLLGFAWWAMGCPFMKRYSKDYLLRNPHKKGKDLQATRKAIELFKKKPAAVMSFVEGTRYTTKKRQHQDSPYKHLLKPKAGGISFVINAMGEQIHSLLDVTIIYSNKNHSLWDFLCQRIESIKIHVRQLPIPAKFTNLELANDNQTQEEFRNWLNDNWFEKDNLIADLKG